MVHILEINEAEIGNGAVVSVLKQIDKHVIETNVKLDDMGQKIADVCGAFPQADFEGHKRYHQVMIDDINSRKELIKAIKEKSFVTLFIMLMGFLCMAVWHEFLGYLGRVGR